MKVSKAVIWLSSLIVGLALVAVGMGLLNPSGGSTFSFTTVRGVSEKAIEDTIDRTLAEAYARSARISA